MKKAIQLILLLGLAAISTGCATPYLGNRGRDAADIFTATAGVGIGAQGRVGPLHAGLGIYVDGVGLRGGSLLSGRFMGDEGLDFDGGIFPAPSPCGDSGCFTASTFAPTNGLAAERGKGYFALSAIPFVTTKLWPQPEDMNDHERHPLSRQNIPYFTQIDCFLAVAGGIRLGFNPGELLDFLLGWVKVDIYKDDLEAKKRIEQAVAGYPPQGVGSPEP